MPARFAEMGDPHARMDDAAGSLEKLLELAARDEASGLGDAPWPPHFRKMEGEAPRVAPVAQRRSAGATRRRGAAGRGPAAASKMPLVIVANSPDQNAALAGLERWKEKHPRGAEQLAIDDVLVDSMRGRSSTWTRIRVNLRHVPEASGRRRRRRTPTTIRPASGAPKRGEDAARPSKDD